MKKISFLFAAMLFAAIGSGIAPVSTSVAHAADAAAEPAKPTVRAAMGKPLTEIQDLLDKKQYTEALDKVNALAAATDKPSPYELFVLARMRAVVASGTNNTALLAESFAVMIDADFLKDNEKLRLIEGLAGTYYNEKKYPEAISWAKRYLAKEDKPELHNLIARAYYLKDDFPNAITELNLIIERDAAAKRVTPQETLRLLGSSYQHTKDNDGYVRVLDLLVQNYPTREYWGDLIYRVEHKPGFSDRLRLDLYRLLLATENIDDGAQYVEFAELALLAGLPAEAKTAVDAGYAANLLGTGKDAAKHKQLRDRVYKQASEDARTLDAGESAAKNAKTGVGLVNIGYNYVINKQAEKGIALMEQGIAKGGLKSVDEARLHLGMAYLQSGNRDKALEVFKTIEGKDGSADLARLWTYIKPAAAK